MISVTKRPMRFRMAIALSLSMLAFSAETSAASIYWSLFNIEGESAISADYVTYATLEDMLADTNRTGVFSPNPLGFGSNIVGSGSDGSTYWSLFNIEGESAISADYVTYATLDDMLTDSNRTGVFSPNPLGFGSNIVGSGAFVVSPVPVPGALWLFASGLLAAFGLRRTNRSSKQSVSTSFGYA